MIQLISCHSRLMFECVFIFATKECLPVFLKTAQYRCQHGTISPHHIQLYLTTVYLKSNPLIPITYWFPDNAKSLVKNLQPSPWTSTYSHFTDTWVFAKSSNEIYGPRILSLVYKSAVIFNTDGWPLCDTPYLWRDQEFHD